MRPDKPKPLNARIEELFKKQPKYVCIGLLTETDIEFLLWSNRNYFYPKHMLFKHCDVVECYIECIWSDEE